MLNLFLDGYKAKITSGAWATLAECSKDTTIHDIQDLVDKDVPVGSIPGAERPSYFTVYDKEDLTQFSMDVNIAEGNDVPYLYILFRAKKPIHEGITEPDADRYPKDDLLLSDSLSKHHSYMAASSRD